MECPDVSGVVAGVDLKNGMKVCFYVTEDWYFFSHRLPIAKAAMKAGHDVVLVTRVNKHGELIKELGVRVIDFRNDRGGTNPFREILSILQLIAIYRRERPDLVHHVAVKPVFYGAIAALFSRVPRVVNALAGLGWLYSSEDWTARLLQASIKLPLGLLLRRGKVIVQNDEDAAVVKSLGVSDVTVIRGSGVDVERFSPTPKPDGTPLVVLVARLLKEKGVGEFAEAARLLQAKGINARFALVGAPDPGNRSSIPESVIEAWVREGVVEWWGRRDDMPDVLKQAHIACLPSYYREGVPKSLLEAAACGLPIVTTDMPGCRDVVVDGEDGLLVPPRDVPSLASALEKLIGNRELRERMGADSRKKVLSRFADTYVAEATLEVYREFDEFLPSAAKRDGNQK